MEGPGTSAAFAEAADTKAGGEKASHLRATPTQIPATRSRTARGSGPQLRESRAGKRGQCTAWGETHHKGRAAIFFQEALAFC